MPNDSIDDDLNHATAEWLRRLEKDQITRQEACKVLRVMKARLEFLQNLHSRIANQTEFDEQARDVQGGIDAQVAEITIIERYTQSSADLPSDAAKS